MSQFTPAGPTGPYDPAASQPAPFPPRRRSWFARHKVLAGLGALVVLFVVIAIASQGGGNPGTAIQPPAQTPAGGTQQTAPEQSATSEPPADEQKAVAVGTPVRDGKFEFTVTQVEAGVKRVGSDMLGQDAQGQYVLLHITVSNIGTEAQYFSGSSQKLHDSTGRTFSADSTAAIYLDESNSLLNQINPGNTVQGIVAFDVPADAALTTVELHDSPFSGGVTVALG